MVVKFGVIVCEIFVFFNFEGGVYGDYVLLGYFYSVLFVSYYDYDY